MSKIIKKASVLLLALVMVLSIAVMAAGCGEKDKKTSSKAKATTQAVETSEESSSAEETQAQDNDDDDGYIDEQSAIAKVREQAGTGAGIDSYYKGTAPDGKKAWVVTVIPVTTNDGPTSVIYYVNADFCYTETTTADNPDSDSDSSNSSSSKSSESSGSYIDRDTAIATVKQQAGSGATVKGAVKGTAPDGKKAWVVTVEPITNGQGPDTVTYYVNDGFCYIG
ncbi:MAG: hypothetical protein IJT79_00410 [Ruminococcus sp.]|nr:hypothetical protein [Ruminococcus sp.]